MTRPSTPEAMLARASIDPTRNPGLTFPTVVALAASTPGFVARWARTAGITLVEGETPSPATSCAFIAFVHDYVWCRTVPPDGQRWSNIEPWEVGR